MGTPGFHGRGADRYSRAWVSALAAVRDLPEDELPTRSPRVEGPPHPRMWADRDVVADRRFKAARASMLMLAEEHHLPVENLLTPDYVRRAMWSPPETREPAELADALRAQLTAYGARPWQVALVTGALTGAVLAGDVEPAPVAATGPVEVDAPPTDG
jgi:ribonuclease D